MKRREFLIGGAAVAWPVVVRAQQPAMPVIGFLNLASADESVDRIIAFRQGLSETGYVEGRNVTIQYRWAEGQSGRLSELAADLVRTQVSVIAATSGVAARAAKMATERIPIIFYVGGDPITNGLVTSLSRPGGNLTGVSNLSTDVGPKRLELLHELVPSASTFGFLISPANSDAARQSAEIQVAARTLGLQVHEVHASTDHDVDSALASLQKLGATGIVIAGGFFFVIATEKLAALTARHRLAAVYEFRQFAAAGGLASYGASFTESYRQIGRYTGRILNGEKTSDLPVQQSSKVELIINLKTAKALGITVPLPILGRADEVIE